MITSAVCRTSIYTMLNPMVVGCPVHYTINTKCGNSITHRKSPALWSKAPSEEEYIKVTIIFQADLVRNRVNSGYTFNRACTFDIHDRWRRELCNPTICLIGRYAARKAQSVSQACFARSTVTHDQYVLMPFHVFTDHQFTNQFFFERRLGFEVEGVQCLDDRKEETQP